MGYQGVRTGHRREGLAPQRQVVVITGASAGVGRAVARAFGAQGARVALLARGADRLEAAAREIRESGGEALAIPSDVADWRQVEAAADQVMREWGRIDVWINNAMATVFSPFIHIAPDDYQRVTEVTYLGYVWGTRAALKRMRDRNQGVIIQVGSALAYRSIPLQSAYCGAKAAIRGFTDSLRSELIHEGSRIRLTMVQLSAFNTPQFDWSRSTMDYQAQPLPPIYQPELAASAILWASRHPRRELWVGLPATKAILGNRVLAPWLDRLMARQAYQGQQTDQLRVEGPDNLYDPLPGDFGAHGRFDRRARTFSGQLWLNQNRNWLAASTAVLGIAAYAWYRRRQLAGVGSKPPGIRRAADEKALEAWRLQPQVRHQSLSEDVSASASNFRRH